MNEVIQKTNHINNFQQVQNVDFDVVFLLLVASVGVLDLFLYCFFGKLTVESYEKMADCLFESNWQDLPINLRKFVIVMIGNAKRPIFYNGFGLTVLNLETFCRVRIQMNEQT